MPYLSTVQRRTGGESRVVDFKQLNVGKGVVETEDSGGTERHPNTVVTISHLIHFTTSQERLHRLKLPVNNGMTS